MNASWALRGAIYGVGSVVTCPHCRGDGMIEIGDVSVAGPTGHYTEAQARVCMLCADDRGDWSRRSKGWIELPITDAQAEIAYECSGDCCARLVDMTVDEGASTCPDCTPERTCYGCWAFGAGPDDGALTW
jgi:hypothetical protein